MPDLSITITDAARSTVTVASPGPQGPAGAALSPVADDTLFGNVSGGVATPVALNTTQVKNLLGYVTGADLQAALANLLQSRIVAGVGISTNYNAGTGILTISAIGTSAGVGTAAIGSTFIVG